MIQSCDLPPEIREAFLAECRYNMECLGADLAALGEPGLSVSSAEPRDRLFIAFHSIKGAAGYLENNELKRLASMAEALIAPARNGGLSLSPEHFHALGLAVGCMKAIVVGGQTENDFHAELKALGAILRRAEEETPRAYNQRLDQESYEHVPDFQKVPLSQRPTRAVGPRILVVDDDFTARLLMHGLVSKFGESHIAVNGSKAVSAFKDAWKKGCPYDLICMDVQMPQMGGLQAVEEIRAIERNEALCCFPVRIFVITAIQEMSVVASFRTLCDAYLIKPIDREKLEDHLVAFHLIAPAGYKPIKAEPLVAELLG